MSCLCASENAWPISSPSRSITLTATRLSAVGFCFMSTLEVFIKDSAIAWPGSARPALLGPASSTSDLPISPSLKNTPLGLA